jgi:hypothetical protein
VVFLWVGHLQQSACQDHVTANLLVGWRNSVVLIQYLKYNADIIHILPYCILPKSVCILLVKSDAVISTISDFNSKLVSSLVVPSGNISNAKAALIQHMRDPPNKTRIIL